MYIFKNKQKWTFTEKISSHRILKAFPFTAPLKRNLHLHTSETERSKWRDRMKLKIKIEANSSLTVTVLTVFHWSPTSLGSSLSVPSVCPSVSPSEVRLIVGLFPAAGNQDRLQSLQLKGSLSFPPHLTTETWGPSSTHFSDAFVTGTHK